MYSITKLFFDFILSFSLLIILLPIVSIISLIIFFKSGSPIFFIQKRIGKNGKSFKMIKLRTMTVGPSLSAENDEKRITNLGRFLRKTSIDEIPVLLNVLKGEMSFVGPRPMPVKYLTRFNDFQIIRLKTRPGITGLAQINGRNNLSWEERFNLDVEYVKTRSFKLDINILFKTVFVVIKQSGVNAKNSEIMPEFFGNKNDNNE